MKNPLKRKARKKAGGHMARNFAAAEISRLTADWTANSLGINDLLKGTLTLIRNRARDLEQSDVYARRYISMLKKNVIGADGLRFKANTKENGQPDRADNELLENWHKLWSKKGNFTMDGVLGRVDAESMILARLAVDGEIFVRLVKGADAPLGLALQIIPAELVDEGHNRPAQDGRPEIRMGVELNKWARPTAYYVKAAENPYSREYTRIPAADMIHLYVQERPFQTRGVSWMAAGMIRKRMLDMTEKSLVVGTRIAANTVGILMGDHPDGNIHDTETPAGRLQIGSESGGALLDWRGYGVEDLKSFGADYPMSNFNDFLKDQLRGIASGWDVSYVNIANNLEGVSFSSIRQGELADQDTYRCLQGLMIRNYAELVTPEAIRAAILFGHLPVPVRKMDKFINAWAFQGRRWEWVRPLEAANAETERMANGSLTFMGHLANHNMTLTEYIEQQQEATAALEAAGLQMPQLEQVQPVAEVSG